MKRMKDIKNYEGLYAVTSCGKVWSYRSKKFLKPTRKANGYLRVCLYKNKEKNYFYVHRLILETYCPCDDMDRLQVNHRNENKENNCLNNLEWMAAKDNMNHGTRNKRAGDKLGKRVLCVETKIIYSSAHEADRQTGVCYQNITKVCRRERKTAGGYHWRYID